MDSQVFDLDDMITCVTREIAMRTRVYPKWVQDGRMRQETATREIACMEAVLAKLCEPLNQPIARIEHEQ